LLLGARAALAAGDTSGAHTGLRAAMRISPSAAAGDAALLLTEIGGLTPEERLVAAHLLGRRGSASRSAREYRAWLAAGQGSPAERSAVRLLLGEALFAAGDYPAAEEALAPLATIPAPAGAEAAYLLGRTRYRRGREARGRETLLAAAARFPSSPRAADALFLVADLSHDERELGQARTLYRRVAREHPGSPRAGLSLMRLGGMAMAEGNHAAALEAWEEARRTFPDGDVRLQATYWSGRALRAMGDSAAAAARFREVRRQQPVSYYSVRAAERLGEPFWPLPLDPSPPPDALARAAVERQLGVLDLLRRAGLHEEAQAEAARLADGAKGTPASFYALAEALIARGYPVQGINLGWKLEEAAGGWNERLLRIVYPFPNRELIAAEARERGLDPFLVAALIRQESTFRERVASPVGARGLMQIMPETGRPLARAARIGDWDPELLYNAEINVHLGTLYLAEQMRTYDERLPQVFSAYNAGPSRVERWSRIFPEGREMELFTERIPFAETRSYVKILTRNIALYRALYGR
ncbi:MAG: transglycosylase SLT domain-containing protein, partial [Gemmatimonadota bacterium]|nr:transglycosylase SLT domain-containing protein [Gemmatimonadota bacterium]